jgi:hypothetical protein
MKYPSRITVDARRGAFKLPPMGWIAVYALALLLAGAMAFFAGR